MCLGWINVDFPTPEWSPPWLLAAFLSLSLISIVSPRYFRSAAPHLSLWVCNSRSISVFPNAPWMSRSCSFIPVMVSPMESLVILRLSISDFWFPSDASNCEMFCSMVWSRTVIDASDMVHKSSACWTLPCVSRSSSHLTFASCSCCPTTALKYCNSMTVTIFPGLVDPFIQSSGLPYKMLTVHMSTLSKQIEHLE